VDALRSRDVTCAPTSVNIPSLPGRPRLLEYGRTVRSSSDCCVVETTSALRGPTLDQLDSPQSWIGRQLIRTRVEYFDGLIECDFWRLLEQVHHRLDHVEVEGCDPFHGLRPPLRPCELIRTLTAHVEQFSDLRNPYEPRSHNLTVLEVW